MAWLKNTVGVILAFAAPLTVLASAIYSYVILAFGEPPFPAQLEIAGVLWATSAGCIWGAFKLRFRSGPN